MWESFAKEASEGDWERNFVKDTEVVEHLQEGASQNLGEMERKRDKKMSQEAGPLAEEHCLAKTYSGARWKMTSEAGGGASGQQRP